MTSTAAIGYLILRALRTEQYPLIADFTLDLQNDQGKYQHRHAVPCHSAFASKLTTCVNVRAHRTNSKQQSDPDSPLLTSRLYYRTCEGVSFTTTVPAASPSTFPSSHKLSQSNVMGYFALQRDRFRTICLTRQQLARGLSQPIGKGHPCLPRSHMPVCSAPGGPRSHAQYAN